MDIKELSEKVAMDLVDAGLPSFPSHRYGFVDRYKVAELIKNSIMQYVLQQKRAQDQKKAPQHPLI